MAQAKRVSFDYDNTLSWYRFDKGIAEKFMTIIQTLHFHGYEVWITTARVYDTSEVRYNNNELYTVANDLGIFEEHIIFTGELYCKSGHLKDKGFIFHLDDNPKEVKEISENCEVSAIDFNDEEWAIQISELIPELNVG